MLESEKIICIAGSNQPIVTRILRFFERIQMPVVGSLSLIETLDVLESHNVWCLMFGFGMDRHSRLMVRGHFESKYPNGLIVEPLGLSEEFLLGLIDRFPGSRQPDYLESRKV